MYSYPVTTVHDIIWQFSLRGIYLTFWDIIFNILYSNLNIKSIELTVNSPFNFAIIHCLRWKLGWKLKIWWPLNIAILFRDFEKQFEVTISSKPKITETTSLVGVYAHIFQLQDLHDLILCFPGDILLRCFVNWVKVDLTFLFPDWKLYFLTSFGYGLLNNYEKHSRQKIVQWKCFQNLYSIKKVHLKKSINEFLPHVYGLWKLPLPGLNSVQ